MPTSNVIDRRNFEAWLISKPPRQYMQLSMFEVWEAAVALERENNKPRIERWLIHKPGKQNE